MKLRVEKKRARREHREARVSARAHAGHHLRWMFAGVLGEMPEFTVTPRAKNTRKLSNILDVIVAEYELAWDEVRALDRTGQLFTTERHDGAPATARVAVRTNAGSFEYDAKVGHTKPPFSVRAKW